MIGLKNPPDLINPIGKRSYELMNNYWQIANITMQADLKEITQGQITAYLDKADQLGVLNMIDPRRLIKIGGGINDVRMVPTQEKKKDWDNEVFSDPILKRFRMIEIPDSHELLCDIVKNYYRAFRVYENDPNEACMAYNHLPEYIDIRTIDGERANPPRIYNETELYYEVVRLAEKRRNLISKIKKPNHYLKHPREYEKSLFYRGTGNNANKQFYDRYLKDCYVINLANHGYRGVRSRIEQWVWEQHVMRYYRRQNTRTLLNNIILDDDGIYCKILVPDTVNEFGILQFVLSLSNFPVYNGLVQTIGYHNFNMIDYYKDFPEVVS